MAKRNYAVPRLFVTNAEGPTVVKAADRPDVVKQLTAAPAQLLKRVKLAVKIKKHHVFCLYKVLNSLALFLSVLIKLINDTS